MVVGTLKNGLKGALPVLIFFFILFIVLSFYSAKPSISDDSVNIFYHFLKKNCTNIININLINLLALVLGTLLISVYSIKQEVVEKQNYIPSFLYIFFSSITLNGQLVHPSLIANVFILVALINITDTYREEHVLPQIFNSSFFISISMFIYVNYAFFVFLFFISQIVLRPFSWREWCVGLLGLAAPVFIYVCVGYLANFTFMDFFNNVAGLFYYFQQPLISEHFYPLFLLLIILLLSTVFKHFTRGLGTKIKTKKNLSVIYWLMALSLINFISKNNNYYFPLIASVIPISILLGDFFYNIKQLKIANTLFFLLLACGSFLFLMNIF